jgi:hypothetical protein
MDRRFGGIGQVPPNVARWATKPEFVPVRNSRRILMDAKIAKLFDDLVEQRLTPEQASELSRALETDPEAAAAFAQLLRAHMDLSEYAGPVRAFSADELRAISAVDGRFDSHLTTSPAHSNDDRDHGRLARRWMKAFSIAAMALVALSAWSLWQAGQRAQQADKSQPVVQAGSEFADGAVARVRRKIDCDWADDRWTVERSAQVVEGQVITLSRGLLILEFKSGAEVTLNGPATLIATSAMSVKLIKGELSANVPPQGRGFRVETHAGNFIDLGTKFGLLVAENGDVETHVFEGKVIAKPARSGDAVIENKLLETGQAWARPIAGKIETGITANSAKFLLPLSADGVVDAATPPVVQNLAIRYSAERLVQKDADGCVSEWGDLAENGTQRRENAWQVTVEDRPRWIARAIGGRPALRFDGYKGLVTEPVKLGPSQSSALVFRVDGDVARELIEERSEYQELGVQLLNLNGPPHSVLQVNRDLTLEARVHLGFVQDPANPIDVGRVRTVAPIDNKPHIVVYSFDTEKQQAQLFFDGRLVADTNSVQKVDTTFAPRYIGSHYEREGFGFTGEIAEVLLYDGALTTEECQSVSSWLGERYGMSIDRDDSSAQASSAR